MLSARDLLVGGQGGGGSSEAAEVLGLRHPHVVLEDAHLLPPHMALPMVQAIANSRQQGGSRKRRRRRTSLLITADPDPSQVREGGRGRVVGR